MNSLCRHSRDQQRIYSAFFTAVVAISGCGVEPRSLHDQAAADEPTAPALVDQDGDVAQPDLVDGGPFFDRCFSPDRYVAPETNWPGAGTPLDDAQIARAVVRLGGGTGFIVDVARGLVLTNFHVVESCAREAGHAGGYFSGPGIACDDITYNYSIVEADGSFRMGEVLPADGDVRILYHPSFADAAMLGELGLDFALVQVNLAPQWNVTALTLHSRPSLPVGATSWVYGFQGATQRPSGDDDGTGGTASSLVRDTLVIDEGSMIGRGYNITSLILSEQLDSAGEPIRVGFAGDGMPIQAYAFATSADTCMGSSGSPTVDIDGVVLGIVHTGPDEMAYWMGQDYGMQDVDVPPWGPMLDCGYQAVSDQQGALTYHVDTCAVAAHMAKNNPQLYRSLFPDGYFDAP